MDAKHKILAGVAVALLCGMALLGGSWLGAHDARIRLEATLSAQNTLLDQANQREKERDAQLQQTLAEIAALKKSVQTPQQVVRELQTQLPQYLPLPQPIELKLPDPAKASPGEAPNPATASIPQADLKPIYDAIQDCRTCKVQLAAAQGNLQDERGKVIALTTQRDAAVKAAKGGGFWARVRHGAKWFVIGAGAGAIAVAASR